MTDDVKTTPRLASESVGEIRRAIRLLEAFREAERVANLLLDQEKHANNLAKEVQDLKGLREDLEGQLGKMDQMLQDKIKEFEDTKAKLEEEITSTGQRKRELIDSAKKEAQGMIAYAQDKVKEVETQKESLLLETKKAQEAFNEETSKLAGVKEEISKQKSIFDKLFGSN